MDLGNGEYPVRNILALPVDPIRENETGRFIKMFPNLDDLHGYLCAHIKDVDNFYLHVPDGHLEELVEKGIHRIEQVRRIYVYAATNDTLQSRQSHFPSGSEGFEKIKFHLARYFKSQLQIAEVGGAVDLSGPDGPTTLDNITTLRLEHLNAKRRNSSDSQSPEPKRSAPTVGNGSFVQNIEPRFICPGCKILFEEPYQLECGHRLCKSCLGTRNRCEVCSKFIAKDKAWFDRGFNNETQHLLVTCLECEWTGPQKLYHEHRNQNHQALLNYFTSNEEIAQNSLHQQILSALDLVHQTNNSNANTDQIQGALSILLNSIKVLNDDRHRMNDELIGYQHSLSVLAQQYSSLKTLVQELNDYISGVELNQNLLYQQFLSLKEQVEDFQATSFDGTFTWKIKNFQEKRTDARSERQRSIYSPPFYSSQTGYKMRLRLFLNGDNDTRGTHMSLYLVIMQGNYDAIVHWPFKFKVIFTLLNQLQLNNHQSKFFWSNTTSSCFQRPNSDMNIPYGFSKFLSHGLLKEDENYYVQDDTVFVKVEIDFLAQKPGKTLLLNSASSIFRLAIPLNDDANELLNDEVHVDTINDNLSVTICSSDTQQ